MFISLQAGKTVLNTYAEATTELNRLIKQYGELEPGARQEITDRIQEARQELKRILPIEER